MAFFTKVQNLRCIWMTSRAFETEGRRVLLPTPSTAVPHGRARGRASLGLPGAVVLLRQRPKGRPAMLAPCFLSLPKRPQSHGPRLCRQGCEVLFSVGGNKLTQSSGRLPVIAGPGAARRPPEVSSLRPWRQWGAESRAKWKCGVLVKE